ncbi:hypothetical protein DH09_08145 [Bacillaceae bacterium JMAK1]|nr:hypothetical protein DH09_08145 [Bacillaceae bacterium JMAK1]
MDGYSLGLKVNVDGYLSEETKIPLVWTIEEKFKLLWGADPTTVPVDQVRLMNGTLYAPSFNDIDQAGISITKAGQIQSPKFEEVGINV